MKHDQDVLKNAKQQTDELLARIGVSAPGAKKQRGVGRPRKENVERYANGQITRKSRVEDVTLTAVKNRVKRHGVTLVDAKDQRAGSPLGRMALGGFITEPQMIAGQSYLDLLTKLKAADGLGSGFAHASRVWDGDGFAFAARHSPTLEESDDRVAFIRRKREEIARLEAFVRDRAGAEAIGWLRGLRAYADDELGIDDITSHARAVSCLRSLLNTLALYFRIGERGVGR